MIGLSDAEKPFKRGLQNCISDCVSCLLFDTECSHDKGHFTCVIISHLNSSDLSPFNQQYNDKVMGSGHILA